MQEIELTIKARNNRLKARRVALGMTIKALSDAAGIEQHLYQSLEVLRCSPLFVNGPCRVPQCKGKASKKTLYVCEDCLATYGGDPDGWPLEMWPLKPGVWRPAVLKLAAFHKCDVGELFPQGVLKIRNNQTSVTVNTDDMQQMLEAIRMEPPQSLLQAATPPDAILEAKEIQEELNGIMGVLSDAQRRLMRDLYVEERSMNEIADKDKVTNYTISLRLNRALQRLRHPNQVKRIKEALGIEYLSPTERQQAEERAKRDAEVTAQRQAQWERYQASLARQQQEAEERNKVRRAAFVQNELAAYKEDRKAQWIAKEAIQLSERYKYTDKGVLLYREALVKLGKRHHMTVDEVITLVKLELHICLRAGCKATLAPHEGGYCDRHW